MVSQPKLIRVPLLEISERVKREDRSGELPQGLKRISEVEVPVTGSLPEYGFALVVPNIPVNSAEPGMSLGIFGVERGVGALNDIFVLGLEGQKPLVQKVVKTDVPSSSHNHEASSLSSSRMKNRRKSFMTPTPLHIPESKVSPIPDSVHEMLYIKDLNADAPLKVVPSREVVWMRPLVLMMENPSA